LVDTGTTEVLLDDRTAEVEATEHSTETVFGNPIESVDVMREITIRQWLEIDDPSFKKKKATQIAMGSRRPSQVSNSGDDDDDLPPVVIPRSDPLDSLVNGTRNCPEYDQWEAALPARWDLVNPRRPSSPNNPEWRQWQKENIEEVKKQWANLLKEGAFFQGPTHSNGYHVVEGHVLSRNLEQGDDEDMADVSDQEHQDAFDEDEDMEDIYEQRGMGNGASADPTSAVPDDDWSSEDDLFEADDGDGGGNGMVPGSDSDSSDSDPPLPDLGPLRRGPDGGAAGFLPMKLFPEYREPIPAGNGDFLDWTDNIQNTVWRPRRVGEKTLKIDLDEPWENITDLEVDGGLDCGRSPYPVSSTCGVR
jgi:hypothetical protein